MHYYQHNIGDYARDTMHLTVVEHGIYRLLIDWCYLNEKPLSLERAMRIGRGYPVETQSVLSEFFFETEDGFFRHRRIEADLVKYHQNAEKNRANGAKGGRKQANGNPVGYQSGAEEKPDGGPNQEPRTNNQEPNKSNSYTSVPDVVDASGDRRPACPHREIIALYHELLPANPQIRAEVWSGAREAVLRTRWSEKPERQNLDWWRRFFAYIGYSSFLTGRTEPTKGRDRPFTPNLEWILKPSNFAKIFEGLYHNPSEQAAYERDFRSDDES